MANNPYTGVPTVPVSGSLPYDYINVEDKVGPGLEKLGAGIDKLGAGIKVATDYSNQVASDNGFNQYQDARTKFLHGDPTQPEIGPDGNPVLGPDGKFMPKRGFLDLSGAEALSAYADAQPKLEDLRKKIGNGLPPGARQAYEVATRRQSAADNAQMGNHVDEARRVYATEVNKTTYENGLNAISADPGNDEGFKHNMGDMIHSNVKTMNLAAGIISQDDPLYKDAVTRGMRGAWTARIKAMADRDPLAAYQMLQDNQGILGDNYHTLAAAIRPLLADRGIYDLVYKGRLPSGEQAHPTRGPAAPAAAPAAKPAAELTFPQGPYGIEKSLSALAKGDVKGAADAGSGIMKLAMPDGFSAPGKIADYISKLPDEDVAALDREIRTNPKVQSSFDQMPVTIKNAFTRRVAAIKPISTPGAAEGGAVPAGVQSHGVKPDPNATSFLQARVTGGAAAYPNSITGMRPEMRDRLSALFQAAPPAIAQGLKIVSGYRDAALQARLYAREPNSGMVAPPGHSQHGMGTAADIGWGNSGLGHAPSEVVQWLHENAPKFGLKFPLSFENWHIEMAETRSGAPGSIASNPMERSRYAIKSIESSGGNYSAVGVETKGGHALGAYQVMSGYLQDWLREAKLPQMSEQDFINNHDIQDKLFEFKFGQYLKQTGNPLAAASMWFTGQPNVGSVRDVLGSSANQYVRKFAAAYYGGAPPGYRGAAGRVPVMMSGGGEGERAAGINIPSKADLFNIAQSSFPDDPEMQREFLSRGNAFINEYNASEAIDRAQVKQMLPDLIAAAEAGVKGVTFPEVMVVAALPPEQADHWRQEFQVASRVGDVMRGVEWASPTEVSNMAADIESGQGVISDMIHLHSKRASTGAGTTGAEPDADTAAFFRLREGAARRLDAEISRRSRALVGPEADPAAYTAQNQTVKDLYAKINQKDPSSFEAYANGQLALQAHLGVPPAAQRVLSRGQAIDIAQRIAGAQDPKLAMTSLASEYGGAWQHVYSDVVTLGGLPGAYQWVQALDDPRDAALLARAVNDTKPRPDGTAGRAWEETLGQAGGKSVVATIKQNIGQDTNIIDLLHSMKMSGSSKRQVDETTQAIETLTYAKVFYEGKDASTASQEAVEAFTKNYEFLGNGGARIPRKFVDATSVLAGDVLQHLGPDKTAYPDLYGKQGMPSVDEYFYLLKSAPTWITNKNETGLLLMDPQGRLVRNKDGTSVTVPFTETLPPSPAATPAGSSDASGLPPGFEPINPPPVNPNSRAIQPPTPEPPAKVAHPVPPAPQLPSPAAPAEAPSKELDDASREAIETYRAALTKTGEFTPAEIEEHVSHYSTLFKKKQKP